MSTEALAQPSLTDLAVHPWPVAQRIAFRFSCVYFFLFCLGNQVINGVLIIPKVDVPDWGTLPPIRPLIFWVAQHIFLVKTEIVYKDSGSGDKTYDWVLVFCTLVFSILAAGLWSFLDRRRHSYPTLLKWFWLFLRLTLASQMFGYGFAKAPPLQMPFPYLSTRMEPFGHMSPMGILWSSIGASPSYEIFAGCAEITGGLLLIFPRTVTLGALVCLADMIQVFMLNMTYDVPVKLFSFHLILMSLLLLSRDAPRLTNLFFLNRPAAPSQIVPLFTTRRASRIATGILAFLWLWMLGNNIYNAWDGWHTYGGGAPKSALYGIWEVERSSIDGRPQPPLLTDNTRYRRVIFDFPEFASFTKMDDTSVGFGAAIDTAKKTLALTARADKNWKAKLAFNRPATDRLLLDGQMDGHLIHMELHLMDEKKFLFATRGFHWISEYPFNR